MEKTAKVPLATACGLYCGVCPMFLDGKCHRCGCDCGNCLGKARNEQCGILRCVRSRQLASCAECGELPCTRLIQFTVDPIWRTHAPCLENLRRRRQIGSAAWLAEQEAQFQDPQQRRRWLALFHECLHKHLEELESNP